MITMSLKKKDFRNFLLKIYLPAPCRWFTHRFHLSTECLSSSDQAAITKYHRLGGLNHKQLFSYSLGGKKSEIWGPAWSGFGENSLPGLWMAILLCPYTMERGSSGFFPFYYGVADSITGAVPSWPHLKLSNYKDSPRNIVMLRIKASTLFGWWCGVWRTQLFNPQKYLSLHIRSAYHPPPHTLMFSITQSGSWWFCNSFMFVSSTITSLRKRQFFLFFLTFTVTSI